jgi:hypothetical protein
MRRLTLTAAADEVDRCHRKWGRGTVRASDEEDYGKGDYEDKDGGPSFAMRYTYVKLRIGHGNQVIWSGEPRDILPLERIQNERLEQTEGDYEYGTLQVNMTLEARTMA